MRLLAVMSYKWTWTRRMGGAHLRCWQKSTIWKESRTKVTCASNHAEQRRSSGLCLLATRCTRSLIRPFKQSHWRRCLLGKSLGLSGKPKTSRTWRAYQRFWIHNAQSTFEGNVGVDGRRRLVLLDFYVYAVGGVRVYGGGCMCGGYCIQQSKLYVQKLLQVRKWRSPWRFYPWYGTLTRF